MADGYARASGKVGVAMATSGPGATNLVTGIATAMLDSSPIVCITGQVASPFLGSDAFQETDITGVTLPITKHNYLVTRVEEIPDALREAFYIARSGRPGPVLVDITKDAQQASTDMEWEGEPDPTPRLSPQPPGFIDRAGSRRRADQRRRSAPSSSPDTESSRRRRARCCRSWWSGPAFRWPPRCSGSAASPQRTR